MNDTKHAEPEQLRQRIEVTKGELDRTLEALKVELSADRLLERGMQYMKQSNSDPLRRLMDTIAQNPIPATVTGVGLAWLLTAEARGHKSATPRIQQWAQEGGDALAATKDRAAETFHEHKGEHHARQAAERLRNAAAHTVEGAKDGVEQARAAAGRTAHEAGRQAQGWADRTQREMETRPWLLAGASLAAGALLGSLLPVGPGSDG